MKILIFSSLPNACSRHMNKESAFAPSLAGVSNLESPLHPQNPRLDVRHGGHPLGLAHPGQTGDGHWSRRQGHVEGERTPVGDSEPVSSRPMGVCVPRYSRAEKGRERLARDRTQGTDRVVMVGRTLHVVSIHLCPLHACLHRAKRPCAATYLPHFGSTGFTFITATSRLLTR